MAARRLGKARLRRNIHLTAYNWLYPGFPAGIVKSDRTVHNTMICDSHSIMSAFERTGGNVTYTASSVQQTVFAVKMKMHKIAHFLLLYHLSI